MCFGVQIEDCVLKFANLRFYFHPFFCILLRSKQVFKQLPNIPVLCILHCVWKRSVGSFRKGQGKDSSQKRRDAEDGEGCGRAVVMQHVDNGCQHTTYPCKHTGYAYSCLPFGTAREKKLFQECVTEITVWWLGQKSHRSTVGNISAV